MSRPSSPPRSPSGSPPPQVPVPPKTPDPKPGSPSLPAQKRTPTTRLKPSFAALLSAKIFNKHIYNINSKDMEGKWLGPVFAENWMTDLAPKTTKEVPHMKDIPFSKMGSTTNGETDFVNIINSSKVLDGHSIFCKDTHRLFGRDESVDSDSEMQYAPDTSFLGRDMPMVVADEDRLERFLSEILFFGELKSKNSQDPCLHITTAADRLKLGQLESDADSDESFRVRGQLVAYARAICANSHRTHLYAFIVLPQFARLLFFDQSGVTFSELFDWRKESYLSRFIQQFASARDTARGMDTSAVRIPYNDSLVREARKIFYQAEEADLLPDEVTFNSIVRTYHPALDPKAPKDAIDNATYWLFYVYDQPSKSFHQVLAYRVHTASPYFVGRATRGYIAVDLTERAVVYMKRSWRIAAPGFPSERDIYWEFEQEENGEKVPHLPGCYFGGDVPRHSRRLAADYFKWKETAGSGDTWTPPEHLGIKPIRTHTYDYAEAHKTTLRRGGTDRTNLTDDEIEMLPHILTVTLFRRVGSRLRNFKNSRQLCIALRDAVETHEAAYRLKKILHRDISDSNILIAKVPGEKGKFEGLLIDWDLCVNVVEQPTARRKGRTGTWTYMSARMLEAPRDFIHEVRDDLESICHVLHYHVYRYLNTVPPLKHGELLTALQHAFDVHEKSDGKTTAQARASYLRNSTHALSQAAAAVTPGALSNVMGTVRWLFGPTYAEEPEAPPAKRATEDERETYKLELKLHKTKVANAVKRLTHQAMLNCFNDELEDEKWKLAKDRPQDHFPLHVREVHNDGGTITRYYQVSTRGVIVLEQSAIERPPKRKVEGSDHLVRDTPSYSRGSGFSLGTDTTTVGSETSEGGSRKKPRLGSDGPESALPKAIVETGSGSESE